VQYHIPAVLRLKGKLNREALQHALQTIVERHEVLRTVIRVAEEGDAYQHVNEPEGGSFPSLMVRHTKKILRVYKTI
jgi:hypothetical protein